MWRPIALTDTVIPADAGISQLETTAAHVGTRRAHHTPISQLESTARLMWGAGALTDTVIPADAGISDLESTAQDDEANQTWVLTSRLATVRL